MNCLKIFIACLIVLIFLSCDTETTTEEKSYPRDGLPPEYTMLCSADSNRFIVAMPYGTRLYKNPYTSEPYTNYSDAAEIAWSQYNFIIGKRDTVNWQKCN